MSGPAPTRTSTTTRHRSTVPRAGNNYHTKTDNFPAQHYQHFSCPTDRKAAHSRQLHPIPTLACSGPAKVGLPPSCRCPCRLSRLLAGGPACRGPRADAPQAGDGARPVSGRCRERRRQPRSHTRVKHRWRRRRSSRTETGPPGDHCGPAADPLARPAGDHGRSRCWQWLPCAAAPGTGQARLERIARVS